VDGEIDRLRAMSYDDLLVPLDDSIHHGIESRQDES
jgi:hypothetical protein